MQNDSSSTIAENRKRSAKTTREQYKYYVDFLSANEILRMNKMSPVSPNAVSEAYERLADGLNAIGGPMRTAQAWKKIFADWRSQTKRKARIINSSKQNNIPIHIKLTKLEEQLLAMILPNPEDLKYDYRSFLLNESKCDTISPLSSTTEDIKCFNENLSDKLENSNNKIQINGCVHSIQMEDKSTQTNFACDDSYNKLALEFLRNIENINLNLGKIVDASLFRTRLDVAIANMKYPNLLMDMDVHNRFSSL